LINFPPAVGSLVPATDNEHNSNNCGLQHGTRDDKARDRRGNRHSLYQAESKDVGTR
jgi:hypothetical protein